MLVNNDGVLSLVASVAVAGVAWALSISPSGRQEYIRGSVCLSSLKLLTSPDRSLSSAIETSLLNVQFEKH